MNAEHFIPLQILSAMISIAFCYESYQIGIRHERERWIEWLRRQQ